MKTVKVHNLILVLVWQSVYTHAKFASVNPNEPGEDTAFGIEMYNLEHPADQ